jgi:predicted dehydrogenase
VDRLRLAIVGCGNISRLNAPGYLQHPRCDVVALCDPVPGRAKRRAAEWGIRPRLYEDLAHVLDDSAVDAVELLTPTWMHADQIVAALGAGKHVSCQKPLAITVAEADRVAAAVARARTIFRVTENFLYYRPSEGQARLTRARSASLAGPHPHHARPTHRGDHDGPEPDAMAWRRDPARNPGGVLFDDGVHKYGTAAYWIGEIGEVSAIVTRGRDFIMETPSVATWRFKDRDCLGIVDYTYAPEMTIRGRYVRVDEFFEIHGTRGIIWVTRCSGEMLDLPPVQVIRGTETVSYQVPMDWRSSFDGAAADFVDGVLDGRQPAQDVRAARTCAGSAGDLRIRARRTRGTPRRSPRACPGYPHPALSSRGRGTSCAPLPPGRERAGLRVGLETERTRPPSTRMVVPVM